MAEIDNKEIISDELYHLAALLSDARICQDTSAINTAAYHCLHYSNEQEWTYQINRLVFELDYPPGGTLPHGNLKNLQLIFTISIKGKYITDFKNICNPFTALTFDLELDCLDENDQPLFSCWHLDKHISVLGNNPPKFTHPEYHFTFGGNKMVEKNLSYGSLFLPPAPRLSYPPMDGVLGIDFILRNYYEKIMVEEILNDPAYIRLVSQAQYRFWRPFSISFASKWFSFPDISIGLDFSHSIIFPELY